MNMTNKNITLMRIFNVFQNIALERFHYYQPITFNLLQTDWLSPTEIDKRLEILVQTIDFLLRKRFSVVSSDGTYA